MSDDFSRHLTSVVAVAFSSLTPHLHTQVKARGADIIIITDKASLAKNLTSKEKTIVIPPNGPLTALLATCPSTWRHTGQQASRMHRPAAQRVRCRWPRGSML